MIEVLLLGRRHGYDATRRAIEQALTLGGSDVAVIRYLLEMERIEQRTPVLALEVGWLDRYERPLPNLQDYDRPLAARGTAERIHERQSSAGRSFYQAVVQTTASTDDGRPMRGWPSKRRRRNRAILLTWMYCWKPKWKNGSGM